jgi:hypothetical protein
MFPFGSERIKRLHHPRHPIRRVGNLCGVEGSLGLRYAEEAMQVPANLST